VAQVPDRAAAQANSIVCFIRAMKDVYRHGRPLSRVASVAKIWRAAAGWGFT
jgi:hypothetical protein